MSYVITRVILYIFKVSNYFLWRHFLFWDPKIMSLSIFTGDWGLWGKSHGDLPAVPRDKGFDPDIFCRNFPFCISPKVVVGFHQNNWTYTFGCTCFLKNKGFLHYFVFALFFPRDLALQIIPIPSPQGNVSVVRFLTWETSSNASSA